MGVRWMCRIRLGIISGTFELKFLRVLRGD
jgi:hypothetical protein